MKALILAGGLGTRLRPLTYGMPKPLVPLLGKPLVSHIIDPLPAEVDTVILAVSYMRDALDAYFSTHDVGRKIVLVNEEQPLGTGGAIKNVSHYLDDTFIAFNGDVVCSIDLNDMLRYHRSHGGIGTMSLWQVEDPSAFGVVGRDMRGRITTFQEKPKREEAISNSINAGVYIFEREILDQIPSGVVSMEREVFPKVLDKGLYGYEFKGHWIDCGTRENILAAQRTLLDLGGGRISPDLIKEEEAAVIGANTVLRAHLRGCRIGPHVYIEDDVLISRGAEVSESMVLRGALVEEGAKVQNSIIGPDCVVARDEVVRDQVLARQ
ncbi:MAG: NDP-sugar synthase [Methanomassiliicoccus sp.]|nr:NDP-sugar synthase [Methanomassiliicoccus sp.]